MPSPTRTSLRPVEIAVVALDVLLGLALCLVAAYVLVVTIGNEMEAADPHGGLIGPLGVMLAGSPGVLFLVAAVGVARRWRGRWWLHGLPPLVPALFLLLADAELL